MALRPLTSQVVMPPKPLKGCKGCHLVKRVEAKTTYWKCLKCDWGATVETHDTRSLWQRLTQVLVTR